MNEEFKKYIIRCRSCGWYEKTTGISSEMEHLTEVKSDCQKCGKPRKFRCLKCKALAKMELIR